MAIENKRNGSVREGGDAARALSFKRLFLAFGERDRLDLSPEDHVRVPLTTRLRSSETKGAADNFIFIAAVSPSPGLGWCTAEMEWAERLLFRSRHIYLLCAGLVNLALGVHFALPERAARRGAAIAGSLLALASALLLFFSFFAEPMAGRWPGLVSNLGLFAMFGGVLLYTVVSLGRTTRSST